MSVRISGTHPTIFSSDFYEREIFQFRKLYTSMHNLYGNSLQHLISFSLNSAPVSFTCMHMLVPIMSAPPCSLALNTPLHSMCNYMILTPKSSPLNAGITMLIGWSKRSVMSLLPSFTVRIWVLASNAKL